MKFNCNIEVKNRNFPEMKKRAVKSVIALGKHPNTDELHLMLFNSSNKTGTKYTLKNNLLQIFTKFINEGKTTIRFKDPPHDLLVQAENIELKCFLRTLKLALENKVPIKDLGLSTLGVTVSKKVISQTKLVIQNRSDYPKNGFPRTLEILKINGIKRCSLDKGILYLQRLTTLDVSDNMINSLPEELNTLPNLRELNISKNDFGECRDWRWIGNKLTHTLISLNMSNNKMKFCPPNLNSLKQLLILNLSNNELNSLPHSIGRMNSLKTLNISNNELCYLPSSLHMLHITTIDLCQNKFSSKINRNNTNSSVKRGTLLELSARSVVKYRLGYTYFTLPFTLIQYLQTAMFCLCGNPVFSQQYRKISSLKFNKVIKAETILRNNNDLVIEYIFCSFKCMETYFNKQL